MKIGSGPSTNFKFSFADATEEPQDLKVETEDTEISKNTTPTRPEPLNLMAGSFVHTGEANDDDNYSKMNLKGMKSTQSLMAQFNSFMVDLVADRLDYTDQLIESGLSPMDAKTVAAAVFEKRGMDAYEKLGKDINEEELENQVEETKKDNKERTEEAVEEKQEEKAAEKKESEEETEAKIEEKITDNSSQSIENLSEDDEVDVNVTASIESSVADSKERSSASTGKDPAIKDFGTGENVNTFV